LPDHLASWNDGETKSAIIDFVERVTTEGRPGYVPSADRVATFDNDGTLWCEKPIPIQPDVFDDGQIKPVRIWSRVGRRPILAAGNSNGDVPMLRYAGGRGRPALRLLVLHDDADREFDYTAGAEQSLEQAAKERWTVVSVDKDWGTVFAP
jgi:hypothetical protein